MLDRSLEEAAELLASHGRRRDAIALVERALLQKPSPETALLLATLFLGADEDSPVGYAYLSRFQWLTASRKRK